MSQLNFNSNLNNLKQFTVNKAEHGLKDISWFYQKGWLSDLKHKITVIQLNLSR